MSGATTPTVIPFNEIPQPPYQLPGSYVEVQPIYQSIGVLPWPARVLIIAQAITGSPGALLTPINITRTAQATALAGAGSMAEMMVNFFFMANQTLPVDLVLVADATGAAAAAGAFTIGGTWTAAGTLAAYVAGVRVAIGFLATDTPATVAAALAAAITANVSLPVTAVQGTGANTNKVTCTAKNAGLAGNNIDLYVGMQPGDSLPQGMTATVTPMAGGATNPDVEQVVNVITGVWYTDIVMPWQDTNNLVEIAAELDRRYGAMVHQDGHAYACITGSFSQQSSTKAAVNGKCLSVFGITNPPTPPWAIAASFAGVCADKLTSDPARQLKDLVLPGVVGSRPVDRRTQQEKNLQLQGGICPFHTLSDNTITLTRVVTTYLTNSAGVADPAFHDIMTPKTSSRVRYDWKSYTQLIYPRNKLSDDNSIAAQYDSTVVTPSRAKASWAARSRVYAQNGWLENTDVLAQQANFVRDPNDRNRLNSTTPVQIIGNAMILADVLQFEV